MQACMYFNIAAGALLFGLSSFAACGGGQSQAIAPSSAEPVAASAPADSSSTATTASPAAAASASETSLAAAAPATATPKPDRDMNDIRAVVAGNRDAFRACYDLSLKAHPGIKGTFVLKFVVSPDGSVKSAEADPVKSEIHASDLEACTIGVLKNLKFPQSKKGMESTVNYPFDFNPKGPR
jgi:outer membrane biosynthesis protein TonB